jgi:hypothetical protein
VLAPVSPHMQPAQDDHPAIKPDHDDHPIIKLDHDDPEDGVNWPWPARRPPYTPQRLIHLRPKANRRPSLSTQGKPPWVPTFVPNVQSPSAKPLPYSTVQKLPLSAEPPGTPALSPRSASAGDHRIQLPAHTYSRGQSAAGRYANSSVISDSVYNRRSADALPITAVYYEDKTDDDMQKRVSDTRARGPSLEEEREQVANRDGWFDPRFPRHKQSVSAVAPSAPGPAAGPATRRPAATHPFDSPVPRPNTLAGAKNIADKPTFDAPWQWRTELSTVHHSQRKEDVSTNADDLELVEVPRHLRRAKRDAREELPSLDEELDAVANSGGWVRPRY